MPAQHKNPKQKKRTAVAPYNFIPLPPVTIAYPQDFPDSPLEPIDQSLYHRGRHTGWIDVTLTTKSPVYIRGPLTPAEYSQMEKEESDPDDQTAHLDKMRNKADFFYTGNPDDPVIPGSSLRGMLRNMVEIVGHGRLAPVMDSRLIYRAVGDTSSHGEAYRRALMFEVKGSKNTYIPKFKGGYIRERDGEWYIQPAQTYNGASYARINHKKLREVGRRNLNRWQRTKNCYQIFVQVGPFDYQEVRGGFVKIKYTKVKRAAATADNNLKPAVVAYSGQISSKESEAVIFPPDENQPWLRLPDGEGDEDNGRDLITAYRDQISPEQAKLLGKDGVLQDKHPVFYIDHEGDVEFFGHTQMFRFPYRRSPQEMLPAAHRDDSRMDIATSIFGQMSRKGERQVAEVGHAGRVFMTDAHLSGPQADLWLSEEPIIPQILSGPKPTTFQHYLTQSQPDVDKGKGLYTYNSSPKKSTLRGYKLYWHKDDVAVKDIAEQAPVDRKKDKVHTQIKPVRSGVTFRFRLYFENLQDLELGALWWAVALPVKGEYCHNLGMGKPLGLGAVQLSPTLHLVETDGEASRYQNLFTAANDSPQWHQGTVDTQTNQARIKEAVRVFEAFIKAVSRYPENQPFAQAPRIQMLLKMLAWPGPDPKNTRYMEIERPDSQAKRGKRNEYRERPVLPDPLQVE